MEGREGWLEKKRHLAKPRKYFFQIDFSTDVVSYFTDDVALGPKRSKRAGTFSLNDAIISNHSTDKIVKALSSPV